MGSGPLGAGEVARMQISSLLQPWFSRTSQALPSNARDIAVPLTVGFFTDILIIQDSTLWRHENLVRGKCMGSI